MRIVSAKTIIKGVEFNTCIEMTVVNDIVDNVILALNGKTVNKYNMPLVIQKENILSPSRIHEYSLARYIVIHVALLMGYSPSATAVNIGRDHSSIYNAVLKTKAYMDTKYSLFINYYNLVAPMYKLPLLEQ